MRVRGIGEALALDNCDGLWTKVNIRGYHWVAIALDFEQTLLWYEDSFRQEGVEEVTSVMN